MLLIKMLFTKQHVTLFFSLVKMKKQLCHMSLFLCLSGISLGHIVGTPAPRPSFIKDGGFSKFSKFSKKEGVPIFSIKKEALVKQEGMIILKKEGMTYFHTNQGGGGRGIQTFCTLWQVQPECMKELNYFRKPSKIYKLVNRVAFYQKYHFY